MKKIILIILVFFFALGIRVWNLNKMGVGIDEAAYMGYEYYQLAKKGGFLSKDLYITPENPPLSRYFYGIVAPFDVERVEENGKFVYKFDRTYTRLVSAIFGSLTVVLVLLIGMRYVSLFVGISAAVILAMLPVFVGLSQLVTLESIRFFFFTATIFSFLTFLEVRSRKYALLTGVLAGCAIETKLTSFLVFPLMLGIFVLYRKFAKQKKPISLKSLGTIFLSAVITFFALWPSALLHLDYIAQYTYQLRLNPNNLPPPEIFFGFVMHSPIIFFPVIALVTTPFVIIILSLVGLKSISDRKKWVLYSFVLWLLAPFLLSFYYNRQHGIRYIVEFYAPFALIAAIGLETISNKISRATWAKILSLFIVGVYLFVILKRITPYYLDYFNIIPGGAKGVAQKELFALGWWGQGFKEAGIFLKKTAPKGATVGLTRAFDDTLLPVPGIRYVKYEEGKDYDYVLTSNNGNVKLGFHEESLNAHYKIVYSVKADGASLVDVYQHK